MKKLIIIALFLASILTGCYEDYMTDYDYTAAYFSYQYPARTVVLDSEVENFEIEVGACYGGRYSYEGQSETVDFVVADTLITNNESILAKGVKLMPASWYTLSNESVINIDNSNVGSISVIINKDSLTSYPDAVEDTYAIPFLMTNASTDSILEGRDFTIVVVKYINEFHGIYYVKGSDFTLNPNGSIADTLVYNNPALELNKLVDVTTLSEDQVTVPRIGSNQSGTRFAYDMKIRTSDGTAILTPGEKSSIKEFVGAAQYNFSEKQFVCNYSYKQSGVEHSVVDTLVYLTTELELEEWK